MKERWSNQPPLGYSIDSAAAHIGVSRATINRALAAGDLAAVKLGSKTLVTADSINAYWSSLAPAKYRNNTTNAA